MPLPDQPQRAPRTISLAKRFYLPRCIGLTLGFVAVFFNLPPQLHGTLVLCALVLYCFGWPHVAYLLARASARPMPTEHRNMLVDAAVSGFFAGALGFNPIPSVAIVIMVTMNNMAMGGPRFMLAGLAATALGAGAAFLGLGAPFTNAMGPGQIAACLPLLTLYPLSLGYVCYLTAIKLAKQRKQLSAMSKTDFLTGLTNRAALNDLLDEWFRVPGAHLNNSVIALIDVDGFKQINDEYGHLAGDRALQKVTDIMCACVRDQDTVGRYGGDEFCVILRNLDRAEAIGILERMRALAQQHAAPQGDVPMPTLSIGAAAYGEHARTSAMWIHLADEAMYEAKRGGRNRVVFAG